MKKLIDQDKDLYRKMDIRVKHVETTLGKTTTEFKEIKQSHNSLLEKVERIEDEMQLSNFDSKNMKEKSADIDKLKDENSSLKVRLKETIEELEGFRIKNDDLEQQITTATKPASTIQDNTKLVAAESENKVLVGENEKLIEEINHLKKELRKPNNVDISKECTNRECKARMEALEHDVETLKLSSEKDLAAKCHALEERNSDLEAKMTFSTDESDKMNSVNEKLRHEIYTKQNKIQELNTVITTTVSEKIMQQEKHMKEKSDFEHQIKRLQHDNLNKETELCDRNEQIKNLVQENENLNTDIKRITSEKMIQSQTHTAEKASFEKQIKTFHHDKTKMETALNKQKQNLILENESLKKDLKRNSQGSYEYRSHAESKIDSLNVEKVALQNELSRKEEECELFKKENTSLKTTGNVIKLLFAFLLYIGKILMAGHTLTWPKAREGNLPKQRTENKF